MSEVVIKEETLKKAEQILKENESLYVDKRLKPFADILNPETNLIKINKRSCRGRYKICEILNLPKSEKKNNEKENKLINEIITVCGWSKAIRKQGNGRFCFVSLNDGSCHLNLQIVVNDNIINYDKLLKLGVSCCFRFTGKLIISPVQNKEDKLLKENLELVLDNNDVHNFEIYGENTDLHKYPLAKKNHTKEYLREIAHIRPRSYFISSVMRIRNALSIATHLFFQSRGFIYIHTPILTTSDCEGGGEMFTVTTLFDKENYKRETTNADVNYINFKKDFFNKQTFLTVSGQLSVESYCSSMGDVYTFGPTFRAEKSHTSRHLAEFWMIEPELAFSDLYDNMECAESYIKYCIKYVLDNNFHDIVYFEENVENGLINRLYNILNEQFSRITYCNAIELLKDYSDIFDVPVSWGMDLQSEHERFLTEKIFKKPIIVYNYPKDLKAFYMKLNDDKKTVAAMDVLVPKIGELLGGSQREDNLELLDDMIKQKKLDMNSYWWYRDLRKYGTHPHSGFGLGFERLVMMITGIDNIKDSIPFPRYPGHADF